MRQKKRLRNEMTRFLRLNDVKFCISLEYMIMRWLEAMNKA